MASFHVVTFGCQMNQHDSERLSEVLEAAGYRAAEAGDADVIVLNTCSVREKAEQKLRSEVGRLRVEKRRRPDLLVVVAGCVAQQEGEALLRDLPAIDLLVGPDNLAELPALLAAAEGGAPPAARTVFDLEAPGFLSARPRPGQVRPTAFVTVMKGCDERCSYCIVPTTRGPERYRPSREILDEARRLVAAGVREITLLGQTVNSYRDPEGRLSRAAAAGDGGLGGAERDPDESEFPELLRALVQAAPELLRLRYTSPHPRHLTPALIRAHAELPALARHVHLPVQSGSDRILKRMIRRYGAAEYLERVERLRAAVPGLTLSTDVIVGFPGETEAEFEATLELVRRVGFVGLFGFKYSERPGTPSLRLADDVPEAEKSRRLTALFAVSDGLRAAHLASLVGSRQEVLVEGLGEEGGRYTGRTERNEIVHLDAPADPTGQLVPVRIRRAFRNSLDAELEPGFTVTPRAAGAVSAPFVAPTPTDALAGSTPAEALAGSTPARRSLPVIPCP
ncbi:MAG: tRNA (N6-isopentenyl adenosine(37)-C2)-methylthiotransferase MiaB [Deltaproteobacteria bacterium]|nr:tRNA (N6-isopentenyl adenosine(37)-C2)-methylthiotransferase MiaB [Deltaproteobacteria bacterium]